jgi:hypothetical protein
VAIPRKVSTPQCRSAEALETPTTAPDRSDLPGRAQGKLEVDRSTALDVAGTTYSIPGSRWIAAEALDAHLADIVGFSPVSE